MIEPKISRLFASTLSHQDHPENLAPARWQDGVTHVSDNHESLRVRESMRDLRVAQDRVPTPATNECHKGVRRERSDELEPIG